MVSSKHEKHSQDISILSCCMLALAVGRGPPQYRPGSTLHMNTGVGTYSAPPPPPPAPQSVTVTWTTALHTLHTDPWRLSALRIDSTNVTHRAPVTRTLLLGSLSSALQIAESAGEPMAVSGVVLGSRDVGVSPHRL